MITPSSRLAVTAAGAALALGLALVLGGCGTDSKQVSAPTSVPTAAAATAGSDSEASIAGDLSAATQSTDSASGDSQLAQQDAATGDSGN